MKGESFNLRTNNNLMTKGLVSGFVYVNKSYYADTPCFDNSTESMHNEQV